MRNARSLEMNTTRSLSMSISWRRWTLKSSGLVPDILTAVSDRSGLSLRIWPLRKPSAATLRLYEWIEPKRSSQHSDARDAYLIWFRIAQLLQGISLGALVEPVECMMI